MASGQGIPQQMVIDAGPQGAGRSGHGHADALSVSLTAGGRRWLVDPGSFCYMCSERDVFRGTCAHNTLQVDGLHQAVPEGPFAWSSIPEVRGEKWIPGETFTYFTGSHSGYMRLDDPVLHRRFIFHLRNEFWLIRDHVEGKEAHNLEIHWHFAPDLKLEEVANAFIALPKDASVRDNDKNARLVLLSTEGSGWTSRLVADYLSPVYGKRDPASSVQLGNYTRLPAEHATMLLPAAVSEIGKLSCTGVKQTGGAESESAYRNDEGGKTHYMIFADRQSAQVGATFRWEQWTSDAEFFYFVVENGRIAHLILCEGHMAEINGKSVINHSSKIERFEWDGKTGKIFSSDNTAAESFAEKALESFTI